MMVVIAISGMPGAGTSTIAKKLAKKLKLKYFSPGEYFKSHAKEKAQIDNVLKVFESGKGKSKKFHKQIDQMQIDLAKKGNVVVCGKLSIIMLKGLADYKIWLDCSIEERARRAAKRDKISFQAALKKTKERERLEVAEWKKDYGLDYRKQKKMSEIVVDSTKLKENETLDYLLKKINTS